MFKALLYWLHSSRRFYVALSISCNTAKCTVTQTEQEGGDKGKQLSYHFRVCVSGYLPQCILDMFHCVKRASCQIDFHFQEVGKVAGRE